MNWDQLIKIISDSKNITAAVFFTSATIVLDRFINSTYIPSVSDDVYISAFILAIFSGCLSLIWLATKIYSFLSSPILNLKRMILVFFLSDTEKLILLEFRDVGSDKIDVRRILEKSPILTPIEISEAVSSLESKGILRVANDRNNCWLINGSEKIVVYLLNTQH